VARPASTAATIVQKLVAVGAEGHEKRDVLRRLIRGEAELKNGIIFCNRKRDVALLQKSLASHGFNVAALHGDMDQRARTVALDGFRSGEVPLLVASDVAARGLDIPAVSHVFNFDVPHHPEDYVHRIGRTGRAGRAGAAFTLASRADERSLAAIETLIGQPIPWAEGDLASLPEDTGDAEPRTRHRGRTGERRPRGGETAKAEPRARKPASRRAPSAPVAAAAETVVTAAPAPRERPVERSREERRPPPRRREEAEDGDTPLGLGSHVPAFMLRPAVVKKEK
jgi:superfamily II DNA/RNA helicase